jgi:hypothetical protein
MSNIILISSSDGNDPSIVEVLPLLPDKVDSSEVYTPGVVVNHTVHINDLNSFLHCIASPAILLSRQSTMWIIRKIIITIFVLAVAHFA